MNITGHKLAIKYLQKTKEFWEETASEARRRGFRSEENVAANFARGEEKKRKWHIEQIKGLK